MSGLYAFLAGAVAVILAWLAGRASRNKDVKAEQKKTHVSESVSKVASEGAYHKGGIEALYENRMREVEKANGNVDELGRIAADLAQRALEKGAVEEER